MTAERKTAFCPQSDVGILDKPKFSPDGYFYSRSTYPRVRLAFQVYSHNPFLAFDGCGFDKNTEKSIRARSLDDQINYYTSCKNAYLETNPALAEWFDDRLSTFSSLRKELGDVCALSIEQIFDLARN